MLQWVEHRYSGHSADTGAGRYVVQADHVIRMGWRCEARYAARFVAAQQPQVWLGYYSTVDEAKGACDGHYTTTSKEITHG